MQISPLFYTRTKTTFASNDNNNLYVNCEIMAHCSHNVIISLEILPMAELGISQSLVIEIFFLCNIILNLRTYKTGKFSKILQEVS